jgi:hypothetical protein
MMTNILDGLGVAPQGGQGETEAVDTANAPEIPRKPMLILRAIASGQLPGVVVPSNTPPIKNNLTPEDIAAMGVGMYRPQSEGLALVLFNSEQAPVETLQSMDQAGKLAEAFPSITEFLGSAGSAEAAQAPEQPQDEPMPERVPIMPPASGVAPQAAQARLKALQPTAPSKRPVPGGGQVLNGLMQRPI